jgi:cell division protein FtsB
MKRIVVTLLGILLICNVGLTAKTSDLQVQIKNIQDSITLLQRSVKVLQTENNDLKHRVDNLEKNQDDNIPDFVLYIFIALVLVLALVLLLGLGVLLFFLKKVIKKISFIKKLEEDQNREPSKKEDLENKIEALPNKTDELTAEIEKIYQKQKPQNNSNALKSQPAPPAQRQSQALYADSIFEGKFNCVRETPNDDTIFELKFNRAGDTQAKVVVYREAYGKVIANPAYLEGCEKQVLVGGNTVTMQREGVAIKDGNGDWIIRTKPEVKIS